MNIFNKIYCRTFQFCFKVALPVLPYTEPEIINSMKDLANLMASKSMNNTLIVTDKGISSLGLYNNLLDELNKANIKYTIYDETTPNPTISNVETVRSIYLENNCSCVIAFGGGSSIDCAKAACARIAKPKQPISKMKGILKIHKKIPTLIAIPTTAGTGSETTVTAVITDDKTHYKYPINDFCLIPKYAVLDYNVTLNLPKQLTSTTGMDALTHAVEAYIGNTTTRYTRAMAEEAVTLIKQYLLRAYHDGHDAIAREKMLRASYCAGIAFTRSYVGYIHGLAHSLGGQYGIPHGLANSVILPLFLEEYGSACHKKLGTLARNCDIADKNDNDAIASQKFILWVKKMNKTMHIPKYLDGINTSDIPLMAKRAAIESNPLYPVPKLMDAKELEKMYYVVGGLNKKSHKAEKEDTENGYRKIS